MPLQPCRAPWDGAVVHWSGAVYACDQMSRDTRAHTTALGTLSGPEARSLDDVLDGPAARRLRARLAAGEVEGLLCGTCDKAGTCNLYGDPVAGQEAGALHGQAGPRHGLDRAWPLQRLELGLTDTCNMRCTMCALSRGEASPAGLPTGGFMALDLARRTVDAAVARAKGVVHLLLHWIGEPLLHPHILDILEHIDGHGSAVRLHLVTNGIGLTETVRTRLLEMRGAHTLNVSLNAWTDPLFRAVNQSNARARVVRHTRAFIDAMAPTRWSFIASAVVCHDDVGDTVQFVRGWDAIIRARGLEPCVVLNGKPATSRAQIMLLTEADDPRSPSRFRQVLRALDIRDADWPLDRWDAVDSAVTGGAPAAPAFSHLDPSDAARAATAWLRAHPHMAPQVLAQLRPGASAPARAGLDAELRRLAFDLGVRSPVPRWMPPTPTTWLLSGDTSDAQACIDADVSEAAAVLSQHPALARALPAQPRVPTTADLSATIVTLAAGTAPTQLTLDAPAWQRASVAGLLTPHDRAGAWLHVSGALPADANWADAYLLMWDPMRLDQALAQLETQGDAKWSRPMCRRWLHAGKDHAPVDSALSADPETTGVLHLALTHDLATFDRLVHAWLDHPPPHRLAWQDLAEVVVHRPGLRTALAQHPAVAALADALARCDTWPPACVLGALQLLHELHPGAAAARLAKVIPVIAPGAAELEPWQHAQLDAFRRASQV